MDRNIHKFCAFLLYNIKNSGIIVQLDNTNVTCLVRVPTKFNNYPHFVDNVLIKITEIKEDKKLIYGYLMRII